MDLKYQVHKTLVDSLNHPELAKKWWKMANRIVLSGGHDSKNRLTHLHVFDSRYESAHDASLIHSHSRGFHSQIVVGALRQERYVVSEKETDPLYTCTEWGTDNQLMTHQVAHLAKASEEVYYERGGYRIGATELHEAHGEDGTVTLIKYDAMEPTGVQTCWPYSDSQIESGPVEFKPGGSSLSPDELRDTISNSLRRWWGEEWS